MDEITIATEEIEEPGMFEELTQAFTGWTIVKWDGDSGYSETTRIICEKDGKQKAFHLIATDLGLGIHTIHDFDPKTNQELYDNLEDVATQLCSHDTRDHLYDYPDEEKKKKKEPVFETSYTQEEFVDNYLDYWLSNDDTVEKYTKVKSRKKNDYNFILISDTLATLEPEELFSFSTLQGDIKFNFVYATPDQFEELKNGIKSLPSKFKWNLKSTQIINSPYYLSYDEVCNKSIASLQDHFEVLHDAYSLRIGYKCKMCGKEWWIKLLDISRCENKKLRNLMKSPDTRMDIFDARKYDEDCWQQNYYAIH